MSGGENILKDCDEDRLVHFAGQGGNLYKNTVITAEYAQAELTQRLIISIRNLDEATSRYSKILVALTFTLLIIGFLQIAITVFAPFTSEWIKLVIFIGATIFIGGTFWKVFKDLFE